MGQLDIGLLLSHNTCKSMFPYPAIAQSQAERLPGRHVPELTVTIRHCPPNLAVRSDIVYKCVRLDLHRVCSSGIRDICCMLHTQRVVRGKRAGSHITESHHFQAVLHIG